MRWTRRQVAALGLGGMAAAWVRADETPPPQTKLGVLLYSYGLRARAPDQAGFDDPIAFLEFCKGRGGAAVQTPLGIRDAAGGTAVRAAAERLGMRVEGIVRPPRDGAADLERFAAELATAKACGATVVRTVLLGGRRYETFTAAEQYAAFATASAATLRRAEPLARKAGVKLAVENHKDFRSDELLELLRTLSSEFVGVCVDTGNNLALLEDPLATAAALAPFALTVHLKDIGVEEAPDGFRMTEVPLGRGVLDLPGIAAALRKGNPRVGFHLEMITRDPLSIPCLSEGYWATLGRVPGRDLARTLSLVRKSGKEPPPRVSSLTPAERLALEDRNVRDSFAYAPQLDLG